MCADSAVLLVVVVQRCWIRKRVVFVVWGWGSRGECELKVLEVLQGDEGITVIRSDLV